MRDIFWSLEDLLLSAHSSEFSPFDHQGQRADRQTTDVEDTEECSTWDLLAKDKNYFYVDRITVSLAID